MKVVLRCDEASSNVTLHINVLTVDESSIVFKGEQPDNSDPKHVQTLYDVDRQFIIFKLDKNMQVKIYSALIYFVNRTIIYILSRTFRSQEQIFV